MNRLDACTVLQKILCFWKGSGRVLEHSAAEGGQRPPKIRFLE